MHQHAVINRYNSLLSKIAPFEYDSHVDTTLGVRPGDLSDIPFLIAGANDRDEARGPFVAQCYSGKLDRCGIVAGTLDREQLDAMSQGGEPPTGRTVACWDTTQGYTDRGIGDTVFDTGPNLLHSRRRQLPGSRADRLELERPRGLLPAGTRAVRRY